MRGSWLALLPVVVLLVALAVRVSGPQVVLSGDTLQLLDGVAATDACLHNGELRCKRGVGQWPPLQYLPALFFKRIGLDRTRTAHGLVHLNGLAVLGTLFLLWLAGRRLGPGLAPILVLTGLASPLLWYGRTGFGEALATLATTAVVVAILLGWRPAVIAVALWAATLSKETALPALLVLALLTTFVRAGFKRPSARSLVPVALGAGAGVVSLALFNLFRFGVPWNDYYLSGDWRMYGLVWKVDFAVAGLVAPNAGLVWFWPVAAALLGVLGVGAVRRLRRSRDAGAAVVVAVLLVLAGLLAAFADWWTPFGWQAFGDRFIVPWVPALVVVAAAAWRAPLAVAVKAFAASRVRVISAGCVISVFGLAQLGAFLAPLQPMRLFSRPSVCAPMPNLFERIPAGDPVAHELHSRCLATLAWRQPPVLVDAYHGLTGTRAGFAALYVLAVAGLLALTAQSSRRPPEWPDARAAVKLPAGL